MNIYTQSYENIYHISHLRVPQTPPAYRALWSGGQAGMENTDYSIHAPRPWRSFKQEQSSAMVVKKRKASLPPLKKIVLNDDPNNEVVDKKRAPTPPIMTVSLQSPGPIMNKLSDDSSDSPSGDENGDLDKSSAFVQNSADQIVNQIFTYETTSPLYFKSFQRGMELEISADGNIP